MSNLRVDLAHPLNAQDAERLGLPAEDVPPGATIVVPEDVARGLIGAGYAQVDTEDQKAVARALNRHAPKDHSVGLLQEESEPEAQRTPTEAAKDTAREQAATVEPSDGTPPAAKRTGRSEK